MRRSTFSWAWLVRGGRVQSRVAKPGRRSGHAQLVNFCLWEVQEDPPLSAASRFLLLYCVDSEISGAGVDLVKKMASKTEERRPSEAPVLDLELDNFLGEAASKAIQKMFPQLRRAVTKDEVPDYLFAEGVLTQSTFELSTNVGLSDSEKGRKYIIEIQHLVGYNPEKFETFCKVLEEHGHGAKDLIKKLRGKFKQQLFHNIAAMSVHTLGNYRTTGIFRGYKISRKGEGFRRFNFNYRHTTIMH